MSAYYIDRITCRCEVCRQFRNDRYSDATCEVCSHGPSKHWPRSSFAAWVPDLVSEFLGFRTICGGCRNSIHLYVSEWGLCWGDSPDRALKWAMLDWLRSHAWLQWFRTLVDGRVWQSEVYFTGYCWSCGKAMTEGVWCEKCSEEIAENHRKYRRFVHAMVSSKPWEVLCNGT